MTKRNVGKTRSVGVRPFHSACFMNHQAWLLPLLLTMIMKAMVMPRRASSESRRRTGLASAAGFEPETGFGDGTVVLIVAISPLQMESLGAGAASAAMCQLRYRFRRRRASQPSLSYGTL